jgi:hypothetical protein
MKFFSGVNHIQGVDGALKVRDYAIRVKPLKELSPPVHRERMR